MYFFNFLHHFGKLHFLRSSLYLKLQFCIHKIIYNLHLQICNMSFLLLCSVSMNSVCLPWSAFSWACHLWVCTYMCMCVHMHAYTCAYVCTCARYVCVHMYMCMWRPEGSLTCYSLGTIHLKILKQDLSLAWNSPIPKASRPVSSVFSRCWDYNALPCRAFTNSGLRHAVQGLCRLSRLPS